MAQGTDRPCDECGHIFRSYSGRRRCNSCRATDRQCAACGETFHGLYRSCDRCRRRERVCVTCGKTFRGTKRQCGGCGSVWERDCSICGNAFRGKGRKCSRCAAPERTCVQCGATFRSAKTPRKCPACRAAERIRAAERVCAACDQVFRVGKGDTCRRCIRATPHPCAKCGQMFTGGDRYCLPCIVTDAICPDCGKAFRKYHAPRCPTCCRIQRECITCRRSFKGATLECLKCVPRTTAEMHARRARKQKAEVAGPVHPSVYRKVRDSGPCVYCGAPATTVDHVRPLTRGGHEAEYNLVPACKRCNSSKFNKLLTEWDPVKVRHGAEHSPIVAAELLLLNANPARLH